MRTAGGWVLLGAGIAAIAGCGSSGNGAAVERPAGAGGSTSSSSSTTTATVASTAASTTAATAATATTDAEAGATGAGGAVATTSSSSGAGGSAVEAPGVFVAVGDGGRRVRSSDDGLTWTDDVVLEPNGGDDMDALRTVAWGKGLFVGGGWRIMTSSDGTAWQDEPPEVFNQNWIGAIAYGAGLFVGVGGYGSRVSSADGTTWAQNTIDTAATHAHDGLVFAEGKGFVSANDMGQRSYSADGIHWEYSTGALDVLTVNVAYGNGVFVGTGGGMVVTSPNGKVWTQVSTLPVDPSSLIFAQGHFTALARGNTPIQGTYGQIFTSSDGVVWVDHPLEFSSNALAYGHGTYVLLDGTKVRRSSDGVSWDVATDLGNSGDSLSWLAFGPGQ